VSAASVKTASTPVASVTGLPVRLVTRIPRSSMCRVKVMMSSTYVSSDA
jgi:hypothetical protein